MKNETEVKLPSKEVQDRLKEIREEMHEDISNTRQADLVLESVALLSGEDEETMVKGLVSTLEEDLGDIAKNAEVLLGIRIGIEICSQMSKEIKEPWFLQKMAMTHAVVQKILDKHTV